MIAGMVLWLAAFVGPDPIPVIAAVKTCDKAAMAAIVKAEPHRRAAFAAAAYAEQQDNAQERATLLERRSAETTPAGKASFELALTQIDSRQRRLDDGRAVEESWRAMIDELRADFLANCALPKSGKDR